MKRVTASQARREWFTLLDEVVAGEVVVLERNGQRVVVRREDRGARATVPDYSKLIGAKDIDTADQWTWAWTPRGQLHLKQAGGRGPRAGKKR